LRLTGSLAALFFMLGTGMFAYGALVTLAVARGSWFARPNRMIAAPAR